MSTLTRKVPVVTYTLLPIFEMKISNRKAAEKCRELAKLEAEALLKTKAENDERLALKKALRAEITETHVVPFTFFQKKLEKKIEQEKAREVALVEARHQKAIEQDLIRTERDWAYRMMRFHEEVGNAKVVPIDIMSLPLLYENTAITKTELLACEHEMVPVMQKFAKLIGFETEVDQFEDITALVLQKPYPYWQYAFSGEKK